METLPPPECRGVWYACGHQVNTLPGHDWVYSGPMATYCAWHRPMAIYAPEVHRTFFVYGNADNAPTISSYDHTSGQFAYPVVLGSNPDGDAHRNPTLFIGGDGHLVVFYGAHGHETHVLRSDRPYDVSAWTHVSDLPDAKTTYPQCWGLQPGEIFVSYRQAPSWETSSWRMTVSRDGGHSWDPPRELINLGESAVYGVTIGATGDTPRRIHFVWSRLGGGTPEEVERKHLWARRYHIYYACSDDGGATWRRGDGTRYDLPITLDTQEEIYNCGQRGVWLKDIQLDAQGRPFVLFIDSEVETYRGLWKVGRRVGGRWEFATIADSDHMYDDGAIALLAEDDIRVYAPTTPVQPSEDGGEIEEWQSTDGGATWTNTRHLTTGSRYSHNNVKLAWNHERGPGDVRMFWSYGDSNTPPETEDVRLHCYGEKWGRGTEIRF
jgi:hypothetical protein